jgi:hypothetical protein
VGLIAFPVHADRGAVWDTGNQLKGYCADNGKSTVYSGFCSGYIIGSVDSMMESDCLAVARRPNVITGQLVDVVKLYLSKHPEKVDERGSTLVAEAITEAFCN